MSTVVHDYHQYTVIFGSEVFNFQIVKLEKLVRLCTNDIQLKRSRHSNTYCRDTIDTAKHS